jgi:hypothetical protein
MLCFQSSFQEQVLGTHMFIGFLGQIKVCKMVGGCEIELTVF